MAQKRKAATSDLDAPRKKARANEVHTSVVTRSARRNAPVQAVFLTTELLENVLRFLPMRDLLLAQRVSKKWRLVIGKSREMQQMLFFEPREADFWWKYSGDEDEDADSSQHWIEKTTTAHDDENAGASSYRAGQLNTLVFTQSTSSSFDLGEFTIVDAASEGANDLFCFLKRPSAERPEASWRRMLVTQPPVNNLFYHWSCTVTATGNDSDLFCKDEDIGHHVTVSDVMQRLEDCEREAKGTLDWGSHFLSTRGVLFTNEEEARVDQIMEMGGGGGEASSRDVRRFVRPPGLPCGPYLVPVAVPERD